VAILWIHEKMQDDGRAEQGNRLEINRYFLAKATSVNDGVLEIWRSRRDLLPYQPHPNSPRLRVQSNEPKRREGTLLWDVEVRYSAELEEREKDENPLARPAKISWSSAMYQRATLFDADKKAIRNAAGDLFDPQDVEDERWVISVKKNVAAVPKWILNYRMVVNDGNVRIQGLTFPKETLRLQGLSISEEQIENNVPFYVVSFELHFREEGWRRPLINRGYNELVESKDPDKPGKRLIPILMGLRGAEERPQDPAFLDREGKAYRDSSGQVTNDILPSQIVTFQVKFHKTKPFGTLPLK
jgi:hypothetical protein